MREPSPSPCCCRSNCCCCCCCYCCCYCCCCCCLHWLCWSSAEMQGWHWKKNKKGKKLWKGEHLNLKHSEVLLISTQSFSLIFLQVKKIENIETGYLDMSPNTPLEASPCPAHPKWPCPIRPASVIFLLWILYKTRKNKTRQEWNHIPNNQSGLDPSYPGFLCHLALTGKLMLSSGSAVKCLFVKPVLLPCPVQHRQSNCFKCRLFFN